VGGFVADQVVGSGIGAWFIERAGGDQAEVGSEIEVAGYVVAAELEEVGDGGREREIFDDGAAEMCVFCRREAAFCLAVEEVGVEFFHGLQRIDEEAAIGLIGSLVGGGEEGLGAEGDDGGGFLPMQGDYGAVDVTGLGGLVEW
jgi:hypothetical protein